MGKQAGARSPESCGKIVLTHQLLSGGDNPLSPTSDSEPGHFVGAALRADCRAFGGLTVLAAWCVAYDDFAPITRPASTDCESAQ